MPPPPTGVIAVIDDDPSVRRGLARLLRSGSFPVLAFESAEAFLTATTTGMTPSCLIVDVHLPGMSGIELQDYLESRRIRWPIILISARPESLPTHRLGRGATVALLRKPISEATLVAALTQATALLP